jgi:hypothetical protein
MAYTPDEFIWNDKDNGQTLYTSPFSKQLPRDPSSIHDIRIAFAMAVTDWTRPVMEHVIWTPSGAILKRYTPDSILVEDENITVKRLWTELIFPRIQSFYDETLTPALEERGFDAEQLYTPVEAGYIRVTDPDITAEQIVREFATQ